MPKEKPKENHKPVSDVSEPIKKEHDPHKHDRIKKAKRLENIEISAKGTVTAGKWVAELENDTVRKTLLRT